MSFTTRVRVLAASAAFLVAIISAPLIVSAATVNTTTTITNASSLATATEVGHSYTVNVSVQAATGATRPTGGITVSDGTATCTDTNPSNGSSGVSTYTCNLTSTSAGTKVITATYAGNTSFTGSTSTGVSHVVNLDTTAPVIAQVTAVPATGTDTTPNYTFSSTEAGTITYGGDCSSSDTSAASGSNTETFNTLSIGTHNNCTIQVTDAAGNASNVLAVNSFTINTLPDLTVALTNNLGGNAVINTPFNWILTINDSSATASFNTNDTVLTDDLPTATYGTPSVVMNGATGTVNCTISGTTSKSLSCKAGSTIAIPVGATIVITLPTTPTATGSLVNPRSGGANTCSVDPTFFGNGNVTESNETNNSCSGTVTVGSAAPATGSLTVTTIVNGGTNVVGDFALKLDGMAITSGTATTTSAASHTVTVTGPAGYTTAISGDCNTSGVVTVTSGGSQTCTVTETATVVTPGTATLTVTTTVVNNGGTKTAADFPLTLNAMAITSGTATTTGTGTFTVVAGTVSGYTATFGGACAADGTITLAANDSKSCTVTETQGAVTAPTVTITPASLPAAVANTAYNQALTANTTATGPFTWSLKSGTLPTGLSLNLAATGLTNAISGIPTTIGTSNFVVSITNGQSSTTIAYSITVGAATLPAFPTAIQNPSFELGATNAPTNWTPDFFDATTPASQTTFAYPVTDGLTGHSGKAATISVSGYAGGAAEWDFDFVAAHAGLNYVFSDHYLSATTTEVEVQYVVDDTNAATMAGDCDVADAYAPGYTFCYQVASNNVPAQNGVWQTFTANIVPPTGAVAMTVLHQLVSNGSLTVDDYSLVQMTDPNAFPQCIVTLSFDDGWKTGYDNNQTILKPAGLKGTYYIITGPAGSNIEAPGNGTPDNPDYMSASNILTLQSDGNEIGVHTRTHPDLTATSTAVLESEVFGARQDLITIGAKPSDTFAYPLGVVGAGEISEIKGSGMVGARTTLDGYNDLHTDPFQLNMQEPLNSALIATPSLASEMEGWAQNASSTKSWLIILFHKIQADCTGESECVTPTDLQALVTYLKNNNIKVVTVSQGTHMYPGVPATGDTIKPTIAQHATVQVATTTASIVTYTVPTVTDNLDTTLTAHCSPLPGSLFQMGTTTVTCSAIDSSGNATSSSFAVVLAPGVVAPVIQIVPTAVSAGVVGSAYSQSLTASTTANGPFTWSKVGTLPAGLTLGTAGTTTTISGTPTAATSSAAVTVTVTNGTLSASQTFTFVVTTAPSLTITPTTLTNGTAGTAYSASLTAGGVNGPFTWSATNLPAWLTLGTTGTTTTITGTPTASSTNTFAVTATNGATSTTQNFTVLVGPNLTKPVISAIGTSTTDTTATITWTTDQPATSIVAYGTDATYGATSTDATLVTSHSVSITSFSQTTDYHFEIITANEAGKTATSTDQTLTTTATPVTPPSSGGGGGGGGGGFSYYGSVQVNSGAATTTSANVNLALNSNASQVWISNDASFSTGGFVTLTTTLPWTLASGVGSKTVYVRFGSGSTTVASAQTSIYLDDGSTAAPVTTTTTTGSNSGGVVLGASISCYNFAKLLVIGSANADVTALQNRLIAEGVYSGPVTGYFGAMTAAGVKAFQAKYGIDQVGTVGPKTRAQLNTCGDSTSSSSSNSSTGGSVLGASTGYQFTRNLSIGMSGNDVTALQNRLTQEGVYNGPITGTFGPLTLAGVKAYQTKYGISPVSGYVGPMTRAQLNK